MTRRHLCLLAALFTLPFLSCLLERGGTDTNVTEPSLASPMGAAVDVQGETAAEITNSVGMKLKLIPAGEFLMGSPESDKEAAAGRGDEYPQHKVRITKLFYLGVTQVTQAQWKSVMGSEPWSSPRMYKDFVQKGPDYPACGVHWDEAVAFCQKLGSKEGVTYRLPTEAEWEYACRAGTTTAYSFGNDESQYGDYAWSFENSGGKTQPVGQKKPNAWGLFMHENKYEWCQDWYQERYASYGTGKAIIDPQGPADGYYRVKRGGSWQMMYFSLRSAYRSYAHPVLGGSTTSFRVARTCL